MRKNVFTKLLIGIDIALVSSIIICFLYRFTLVITEDTNIFLLLGTGDFSMFSFFDGVIKINLVFVTIISVLLYFLKSKKQEPTKKHMVLIFVAIILLFLTSHILHLGSYDLKYYTIYAFSGLSDYGFSEKECKYENYLPFLDKFKDVTSKESRYSCTESTTPLGYYLYMEENCDELEVEFCYEELQTNSKLALLQFIVTKGTPEIENENGETVRIEAVEKTEFNCKVYSYEDFYEIWFEKSDNVTIIKYEKIGELFKMSEEDILKHAKEMYDDLCGKFSENKRTVNWEYATFGIED